MQQGEMPYMGQVGMLEIEFFGEFRTVQNHN